MVGVFVYWIYIIFYFEYCRVIIFIIFALWIIVWIIVNDECIWLISYELCMFSDSYWNLLGNRISIRLYTDFRIYLFIFSLSSDILYCVLIIFQLIAIFSVTILLLIFIIYIRNYCIHRFCLYFYIFGCLLFLVIIRQPKYLGGARVCVFWFVFLYTRFSLWVFFT